MIELIRIDNRLIHGQVVEAWVPVLDVRRVLVLDDQAAANPLARAAMGLAVPSPIEVVIAPLTGTDLAGLQAAPVRTLLLLREVSSAVQAKGQGLTLGLLNLGNVHFSSNRKQVTDSVFLSLEEVESLKGLAQSGAKIELRALPTDRPLGLSDIEARVTGHTAHSPPSSPARPHER